MDTSSEEYINIDSISARNIADRVPLQERHPLQQNYQHNGINNNLGNMMQNHKKNSSYTEQHLKELVFCNQRVQRNLQSSVEKPSNYRNIDNRSSERKENFMNSNFFSNLEDQICKREKNIMNLENEIIEKENMNCTFRPAINKPSKSNNEPRPLYMRWKDEVEGKKKRNEEAVQRKLQREKEEEELWRPKKKVDVFNRKHMYDQGKKYLDMKKKKTLNALNSKEDEFIMPNFTPKLNRGYNSTIKMTAFQARQDEFLQKKETRKSLIEKEINPKFKPQLNQNSLRMIKTTQAERLNQLNTSKDLTVVFERGASKEKLGKKSQIHTRNTSKEQLIKIEDNYKTNRTTNKTKASTGKSDKDAFTRLTSKRNSNQAIVANIQPKHDIKNKRFSESDMNYNSVDSLMQNVDSKIFNQVYSKPMFTKKVAPSQESITNTTKESSDNKLSNYCSVNDLDNDRFFLNDIRKN